MFRHIFKYFGNWVNGMNVFYFSGTGNSLVIAKIIAENTNSELFSIPTDIRVSTNKDISIIFPSYLAASTGAPLIVEKFVRNLKDFDDQDIYLVCTCGGYEITNALPSLHKLEKLIKINGGKVRGSFSVRMPMNNQDYDHIPIPIVKDIEKINNNANIKANNISKLISMKSKTKRKLIKQLFYFFMFPMFKIISIYMKLKH